MKGAVVTLIEMSILTILSLIDIKKREIPLPMLVVSAILLFFPMWKEGRVDLPGGLMGILLILLSVASRQALGLADAFILLIFGMREGILLMTGIFLAGDLLLLLTAILRFAFLRKRDRELPLLPFLTLSYFLYTGI